MASRQELRHPILTPEISRFVKEITCAQGMPSEVRALSRTRSRHPGSVLAATGHRFAATAIAAIVMLTPAQCSHCQVAEPVDKPQTVSQEDHAMPQSAPRWAISQKRAMDALRKLSYWWYDRQDLDAGAGFEDDDVESILVSAPTLVLGQDDPKARRAFYILAEQMWQQWGMDGDREVGYPVSIDTGDIEHSAEPIAFSQPNAAIVDPGSPIYIERCMISMQNLSVWSGMNSAGHRHFKAFFFGAGGIKDVKYYDCDIPMNARAVIPGVYLAWYNRSPEMMRWLTEYADAWVEHAMDTSMGKPLGVVPSEVRFADDKVGGYSGRWDQIAGYRQFDWSSYHRSAYNMYYFFISMYLLTGDGKYLQPVRETIKHLAEVYGAGDASGYAAMYRSFTGRTDLDYLFEGLASRDPLWKWFTSRNTDALAEWCDSFAADVEGKMNARTVNLDTRDPCANYETCVDDSVLRLMYTGGLGHQVGAYPFVRVSWTGVDHNFAALVNDSTEGSIDVLVYSFSEEPVSAGMVVWDAAPGLYHIKQKIENGVSDSRLDDGERVQRVGRWQKVPVTLLPRTLQRITLRRTSSEAAPDLAPDLALCVDDVLCSKADPKPGDRVSVTAVIHNIGSADARDVVVEARESPSGVSIWRKKIDKLPAPTGFRPSRMELSFEWLVGAGAEGIEISADHEQDVPEVTLTNNAVRLLTSQLRSERWIPNVRIYRDPPPAEPPRELLAVRRSSPPGLDWSIDDPYWGGIAEALLRERMYSDLEHLSNSTSVRASYDDKNLYVFYSCNDPSPETLMARLTEKDSRLWDDESVELMIDPHHDHKFYYHFVVNAIGTTYDAEMVSPFWDGSWNARTRTCASGWEVQMTLPLETLGVSPSSGDTIGINFVRTNFADADRGDRQTSAWQKVPGWTLRPAYFGHLKFE